MKGHAMTELQQRARELMDNLPPMCGHSVPDLLWDEFIVTIKTTEIVVWSFQCLTCERQDCPVHSGNFQKKNQIGEKIFPV